MSAAEAPGGATGQSRPLLLAPAVTPLLLGQVFHAGTLDRPPALAGSEVAR
ncbi:MAG TPA: hypothetical protein VE995_06455 [Gaiellaceae bacterium]|nr:hypothetical protein [Gaiellaceae bacterium]